MYIAGWERRARPLPRHAALVLHVQPLPRSRVVTAASPSSSSPPSCRDSLLLGVRDDGEDAPASYPRESRPGPHDKMLARVRAPLHRAFSSTSKQTTTLVLLRHGQSTWNETNQFTGWADVPLTLKGQGEAREAGRLMRQEKLEFDVVYCSVLKRAIKTLWLALEEMDRMWLPVNFTWRLNERHYGALQGLNKAETQEKYGEKQVMEWRRSYAIPPPPVDRQSEHYPGNDPRYKDANPADLPLTESLKTTGERFMPEWNQVIGPKLAAGQNVLITAHGNSLRALVMHLDAISETDILNLNIPTGVPLVYEIDCATLKPVPTKGAIAPLKGRYLGDAEAVAMAAQAVANQTKQKQ